MATSMRICGANLNHTDSHKPGRVRPSLESRFHSTGCASYPVALLTQLGIPLRTVQAAVTLQMRRAALGLAVLRRPLGDTVVRGLTFPYSRLRTLAVRNTPCSLAISAAAANNGSGIGSRPVWDFRLV